jgi:hypothetical protein
LKRGSFFKIDRRRQNLSGGFVLAPVVLVAAELIDVDPLRRGGEFTRHPPPGIVKPSLANATPLEVAYLLC